MFIWKRTDSQMEKVIRLILLCGLVSIPSSLEENLAFKGTATQSSDNGLNWLASIAIDGLRYGVHCSHTAYQSNPWWRLDLQKSYGISTVIITARSDCCTDETIGAEIRIGDSLDNNGNNNPICAVTSSGNTVSYSCNGMEGRYVNVVMTGRTYYLSLCEVEVYETENLAFKGTATQSSLYYSSVAKQAIDGIKYGAGENACSITGYQSSPWWRLDLLHSYEISTVIITARSDGYMDQTNGAEIRIGNSLVNNGNNNPRCAVTSGFLPRNTNSYSCGVMEGRYVNVFMSGRTSHLSLCDVEIHGKRRRKKTLLRLKLSSSVDAAAVSDKILRQLQFALALHMSDFNVSWTKLPQQELKQTNTGSCPKSSF